MPLIVFGLLSPGEAQTDSGAATLSSFPFVLPWDDASKTITDVSALNPAPLEEKHHVVARDGHFYDGTGRRVRFLGVNFSFAPNFPDKAEAEKVAARMHKYGINCVRMHHMDTAKAPRGIFDPKFPDHQHLDPGQLDKMDYLISQFKRHGIYVDVNLHVGRELDQGDGFPSAGENRAFRLGKVTAYFEPKMMELQKNYARDLLTHLNPYTKTRYVDEPTVALIEINNEDTLLGAGWNDTLLQLPDYYRNQLVSQWNEFLHARYDSTVKLLAAWNAGAQPMGDNLLKNTDLKAGTEGWTREVRAPAQMDLTVEESGATANRGLGERALHVKIPVSNETGRPLQLHQVGLDLKDGNTYTVSFRARANAPRTMTVNARVHQAPWNGVGLSRNVQLTPQWKRFSFRFTASNTVPGKNRLSFVPGDVSGDVWLASVSLRPGSALELDAGESLENRTINLPVITATPQGHDYAAFLMDVEVRYANGMRRYIRETLGAKALVTCSQASYGGLGGVWRESQMDYVDMHAYWQHPKFPNRPWDPQDWTIPNISMTKAMDGGTLPRLAMHRVAGKPFTVSEYNHPAPNDFAAETLPMLAAYAVSQDWDGIFLYTYAHSTESWKSERIQSYFDVASNPSKMAFFPTAARLFNSFSENPRMPDNFASHFVLNVPRDRIIELSTGKGHVMADLWAQFGVKSQDMIQNRISVRFDAGELGVTRTPTLPGAGLQWNSTDGLFKITSPGVKGLIGFLNEGLVAGDQFEIISPQPQFAALTLSSLDGKPVAVSASLLLTAMNRAENVGMKWNEKRDSVGNGWGTGPVQIMGIRGDIRIPTNGRAVTVYALDATGARAKTIPSQLVGDQVSFRISPEHRTVWYQIALQ